jgi:hypothetical protein
MAGGNSHQRAMERAAESRIKRQLSAAVAEYLGGDKVEKTRSGEPPWYERGLFWGLISLAAAIVLTVIAAMQRDLRWLLMLVWPLTVIPLWLACRELKLQSARWSLFVGLSLSTVFGLWRLNVVLKPLVIAPSHSTNSASITEDISGRKNDKVDVVVTPKLHLPAVPVKKHSSSTNEKSPVRVLPQESDARFHERIDAYLFSLGENGITTSATVDGLKKGNVPFAGLPITVFAKEDDDKIHYRIRIWNGLRAMEITDGEFAFNEPYGDRNFDDTALEIVDDHQKPMLQVIWKTSSHLVINGIFRMQNGAIVIADSNGWRPMQAGDSIKPLFKYPSYRFRGQYAD